MTSPLLRGLFSNWTGLIAAGVIGFFISPFVVHHLGPDVYGVWALIVSVTSQLMILDFGVRNAVTQFIAEERGSGGDEASVVASSAAVLTVLAGGLGLLLMLLLMPFVGSVFSIPFELTSLARWLLLLAALDAAYELATGVFDATLAGTERYGTLNILNTSRLILNAIILVIILPFGAGAIGVAITALLLRFLQRTLGGILTLRGKPQIILRREYVSVRMIRKIASYGFWACIIVLSNRVIYQTDTIVLGMFSAPATVTLYAVAAILVEQFRMFSQTSNIILTPRLTMLIGRGERERAELLLLRWSSYNTILGIAVGVPIVLCGDKFLQLWMGPQYQGASVILEILIYPFFVTLPAFSLGTYLYSLRRHDLFAKLAAVEASANLVLSILFVRLYGAAGVAFGTLIPAVLIRGVVMPVLVCRVMGLPFSRYIRTSFVAAIPLCLFYIAMVWTARSLFVMDSWATLLMGNGLCFALLVVVTWAFFLNPIERRDVMAIVKRSAPS